MEEPISKFEVKQIIPSAELKALLKQARRAISVPDYITPIPLPKLIGELDLSLVLILDTKPSCRKQLINDAILSKLSEIGTYIDAQIQSLPDKLAIELLNSIFKMMDEMIDQLIMPYDSIISGALNTYNRIVRLFRKMATPGISKDDKVRYKTEITYQLRKLIQQIPFAVDIIAIILLIECLKTTSKTLRDAKKASPDEYASTTEKIKSTVEILDQEFLMASEVIVTIVYMFKLLLPIILSLSAIFTTGKAFDKELNDKTQEMLIEQNKHNESQLRTQLNMTALEYYAKNSLNNFTYDRPKKY